MKKLTAKQKETVRKGIASLESDFSISRVKNRWGRVVSTYEEPPKRRTKSLQNEHQSNVDTEWFDDIVVGIIRAYPVATSHKGFKFKPSVVKRIFSELDVITVYGIKMLAHVGKSQAANYFDAVATIHEFADRDKPHSRHIQVGNRDELIAPPRLIKLSEWKGTGKINPDLFPKAANNGLHSDAPDDGGVIEFEFEFDLTA